MPRERPSSSDSRIVCSRRRFLATTGTVAGVAAAGCSGFGPPSGTGGEGDTVEILVSNAAADPARIAVRVEDGDGAALFSRVYELDPGHLDESAGIDGRPATVAVFTPGGQSAEWAYAPPDGVDCEGFDIGIRLTESRGFESYYNC